MNVLIADDEPLARQRLKRLVEEIDPTFKVYSDAENGLQALQQCIELQPHIAFFDIRMPKMDGLHAAAEIRNAKLKTHIIFVTAYDEYALEAFNKNAIDYLLKPVKKERLKQSIEKVATINEQQQINLPSPLKRPRQVLCAHTHKGLEVLNVKDIIYFKADHKYVQASTTDSAILLVDSLKALETEFSDVFFRIHRNALINVSAIKAISKTADGQSEIHLHGTKETLAISQRHQPALNKRLRT
ncbi:MAG TPA: response regulator transcription factor [Cycloclasticus sp.]|jgi:two-component system response regulator AlgR|nr:response regulator transcription factor [Cycloclasticus sp.]HIL91902.1 response regulator transcription factor [Cycloclasticus sp.]